MGGRCPEEKEFHQIVPVGVRPGSHLSLVTLTAISLNGGTTQRRLLLPTADRLAGVVDCCCQTVIVSERWRLTCAAELLSNCTDSSTIRWPSEKKLCTPAPHHEYNAPIFDFTSVEEIVWLCLSFHALYNKIRGSRVFRKHMYGENGSVFCTLHSRSLNSVFF